MIVLLISTICVLSVIALGIRSLFGVFINTRESETQARIGTGLWGSLDVFRLQVGHYPGDLNELLNPPPNPADAARWKGPYLKSAEKLRDAWGRSYYYASPGRRNPDSYDLWSPGPDGLPETADDITNWSSP